ncbi:MAG TPA: S41 family peptidase [Gemmatimonadales bacterium]|jgi:hypothetical protein|nr:S41 family peptidase [Gemmatimonadales bacterium]
MKIPGLACSLLLATVVPHRAAVAAQDVPCPTTLSHLSAKVESDYAGFFLEVRGARRAQYDTSLARLRTRAAHASSDGCLALLQDYLAWFGDPHLFLFQSAELDDSEVVRRQHAVTVLAFDSLAFKARLARPDVQRDPIEGIWTDGRLRAAVEPEGTPRSGRYVAVVLTPDTVGWPVGAVRARFTRIRPGRYQADLSLANFARRRLEADFYRGDLLRTSPGMWGREAPAAALVPGQLDPADPHRPTLRIHDRAAIVAMPSNDPAYAPVLDSLVTASAQALQSVDVLILDLRGNEGGSIATVFPLVPYMVTDGQAAPPLLDQASARMLSSPDQIAFARRAFGPDTSAFVRALVARLERSPGQLVPFLDPQSPPPPDGMPPAIQGPRRVGVIVDHGTVSAAEVVALYARQSARVTIYGEPTAGALDYQSVSIIPLSPEEHRWYLGYPTLARNDRLPAGGMRGHGIEPDVHLDLAHLEDPVGWVERDLSRR